MSEPTTEELLAEIRTLRTRLDAIESSTKRSPGIDADTVERAPVSRRALFGIAGAGVAGAAVLSTASPAAADVLATAAANDGDALMAGDQNIFQSEMTFQVTTASSANQDLLTLRNNDATNTGAVLEIDQNSTTTGRAIEVQHSGLDQAILVTNTGNAIGIDVVSPAAANKASIKVANNGTANSINAIAANASQTSANVNSQTAGSGAAFAATATGTGAGLIANTASGTAVSATSTSGTGVFGSGTTGVTGTGTTGVTGTGTTGVGTSGSSNSNSGVKGTSSTGAGLEGISTSGDGLVASGTTGATTTGTTGPGLDASSTSGPGLLATSSSGAGVTAASTSGRGVSATTAGSSAAVYGSNTGSGYGGEFNAASTRAQIRLVPGGAAGAPSSGTHSAGELFADSAGDLYYCTVGGTPGTFTKLNNQPTGGGGGGGGPVLTLLDKPVRAFDSRAGRSPDTAGPGPKGQFSGAETRTIDLNSAATGIPSGATAALVNLTVILAASDNGFASVYSAAKATSTPTFSSINWDHAGAIVANEITSAVDAQAKVKVYTSGPTDIALDVIGYYA